MTMKAMRFFLLLSLCLAASSLKGQEQTADSISLFEYFYTGTDSFIDVELTTDLRLLVRRKLLEEYQPAVFRFAGPEATPQAWECKIRSRGNIRKSQCFYPPVRLNVQKEHLEALALRRESDKIKVVLQCRQGTVNEDYLYKEYLIYKMYNLLDPVSYNIQLTRFTFHDPDGKRDPEVLNGFILEPIEDLAHRVGGQVVEREGASSVMMESEPYNIMTTFQYLIGNTDWSPKNMHNLSTVKLPDERKMHPIPYDFDYTGLVDAFYAIPAEQSGLKSVRERVYNGQAVTDAEAHFLINLFQEKKKALLQVIHQFPYMDEKEKARVLSYLDDFFKLLDRPESIKNLLQRK